MKRSRRRGSALIIALIVVIIVVGIGGAFLVDTIARSQTGARAVQSDEAQLVCEAALEKVRRALYVYKSEGTYAWNEIVADHAAMSIDPDAHWADYLVRKDDPDFAAYWASFDQSGVNTLDDAPLPADPDHFLGVTKPFGEGGFMAVVRDNDDGDSDPLADIDNKLLVYVTASLPDGTQRQIEALVEYDPGVFTPDVAILVDGSLKLNGNPDILGSLGSVHANSSLDISGNPNIALNATTAGTLTVSGNPTVGGNLGSAPYVNVPEINVADYKTQADYILDANGNVYDEMGNFVADGKKGWNNFKFTGQNWDISGNSAPMPAAYYIETDFKISGNPGTPASPVKATFFVQGSFAVSGNPSLQPFLYDIAAISGADVQVSGNPDGLYEGFYYAYEQLKISGNPNLVGSFVAKNLQDVSNEVTSGSSTDPLAGQVSGNPQITYDGGLNTGIPTAGGVNVRNMRRLK